MSKIIGYTCDGKFDSDCIMEESEILGESWLDTLEACSVCGKKHYCEECSIRVRCDNCTEIFCPSCSQLHETEDGDDYCSKCYGEYLDEKRTEIQKNDDSD